jgi:hypothetical protein
MKNKTIFWILIAVLVTVIVFAASIAWSVFVTLLAIGFRLLPFILFGILIIWMWNKKNGKNGRNS